jgi:hypothetical protein
VFRRGGKVITKLIVGYRTCDYTILAMINSAISTFKVVVEKLTSTLKLCKKIGNQFLNKIAFRHPPHEPSRKSIVTLFLCFSVTKLKAQQHN